MTATKGTFIGMFAISMASLMIEILLTRVFSVTLYYHLAFMAISLAMFGMTLGALIVHFSPGSFPPERVHHQLVWSSILFGIFMILSLIAHLFAPMIAETGLGILTFTYVTCFIPFIFSGICICLTLTVFSQQVPRLYAADLAGAALGCIGLILLLKIVDGLVAVFAVALVAALAALAYSTAAEKRLKVISGICVTVFAFLVVGLSLAASSGNPLLKIHWIKGAFVTQPIYVTWNSFSYVQVAKDLEPSRPLGWGLSTMYQGKQKAEEYFLEIDAIAGTAMTHFTGDWSKLDHLRYDVTNFAHYLRPGSNVLVVGAGGGRDVLSALGFGQKSVVAVEINPAILNILNQRFGDFTGHLDRDPRVHFVNDEARSYIARQSRTFDIIQISLIDTFAATAAGAYVLSENSLYTKEAWKIFLSHLSDRGVLTVSRWYYYRKPGEIYRLTSLAASALKEMGIENPRQHMILVKNLGPAAQPVVRNAVGTMLVSRSPFSEADLSRAEEIANSMRFQLVLTPKDSADGTFAALASGKNLEQFTSSYPIDISPPTDDRPFFFNMLRFRDILKPKLLEQGIMSFNMRAVVILGYLLLLVTVLTLLCIVVPLFLKSRASITRQSSVFILFFCCIGFGFMLFEIAQMQRLNLFLGHPVYGLSVVLFSLLVSSGIGSYFSDRKLGPIVNPLYKLAILICVLSVLGILTPWIVHNTDSQSTPIRILIAFGMLVPAGFFLGMPFPLAMKLAAGTDPAMTAWFWGMNGATSVCASVLATAIAMSAGISTAYWVGLAFYLLAFGAFAAILRKHSQLNTGARIQDSILTKP